MTRLALRLALFLQGLVALLMLLAGLRELAVALISHQLGMPLSSGVRVAYFCYVVLVASAGLVGLILLDGHHARRRAAGRSLTLAHCPLLVPVLVAFPMPENLGFASLWPLLMITLGSAVVVLRQAAERLQRGEVRTDG